MLFVLVSPFVTTLGEEGAGLCASRTFLCLFCVCMFLSFSLPLGVEGWLLFVIVAYPGPFYLLFASGALLRHLLNGRA